MARLLVIDPDAALRAALVQSLTAAGHDVEVAASGDSGLFLARASRPDMVIVDLGLTGTSGYEVCRLLRADPVTRRILLFAIGAGADETARVRAFESGADDMLGKPASLRELVLRVRALLRRRRSVPESEGIEVGTLRIDRASRRAVVAGRILELTVREFDLLLRLAERKGRVQTREALVTELWPDEVQSPRVVDTTVKRLRRKLGEAADAIQTIRGVGYRLTLAD